MIHGIIDRRQITLVTIQRSFVMFILTRQTSEAGKLQSHARFVLGVCNRLVSMVIIPERWLTADVPREVSFSCIKLEQ